MVEAGGWRPGRQSFAAQIAETFLKAGEVGARLRIASGNGAAGAGIAALKMDFADAETDHAALVFAVELIFPERGQVSVLARRVRCTVGAIDFERGTKTLARAVKRQAGKPIAHHLQRRRGNNRRAVGDGVVGETFRSVAHQDLLLEIDAEPFGGLFRAAGEGKRPCGKVAAIAWNRERDRAEIRSVGSAN